MRTFFTNSFKLALLAALLLCTGCGATVGGASFGSNKLGNKVKVKSLDYERLHIEGYDGTAREISRGLQKNDSTINVEDPRRQKERE